MNRSSPPKRQTPPKRGVRPKARNTKRKRREWLRSYGSAERVEWIRNHPSVISGKTPCENCHVRIGGMGRKADYHYIVPMTAVEHAELHAIGAISFQERYEINLISEAERIDNLWRASSGERDET